MSLSYKHKHRGKGIIVLLLFLGLILWTGLWTIKHFMAEAYCNTVTNSTLNRDQEPPLEEIMKAIEWDSSNAAYWYKLAEGLRSEGRGRMSDVGGQESEDRGRKAEDIIGDNLRNLRIVSALEQAVRLNPFEAQYHLRLGWEYAHLWKEPDYHKRWLPAADISMDRAAYFAGEKTPRLHVVLGNYWAMRSKTILPSNPEHHAAWSKACRHYKKAQRIEGGKEQTSEVGSQKSGRDGVKRKESKELKRMKKEIRDYVWNFYPDEEMVKQVIQ